jgi:RES domain-containing protein
VILYRVAAKKYVKSWQDAFSGIGSFRGGGRWSSPGTYMVYTSTHLSLASLEVLVHCNKSSFLDSRLTVRFEIDDNLLQTLEDKDLPVQWNSIPESITTQRLGDAWVLGKSSVGLIVPSATLPPGTYTERNVLLNPNYPDFFRLIRNPVSQDFDFDERIGTLTK